MTLNEVNNLKSDILFGSSHCSCGSCDSVLCFTKRNIKSNECRCNVCQEPNSCNQLTRNDYLSKNVINNDPYNKIKYNTPKKVNIKSIPYDDPVKPHDNVKSDGRHRKKNVTVQISPQQTWDTTIKYKNENKPELNSDYQVDSHTPLSNIVNKMLTTYNEISVHDIVDTIKGIYKSCSLKVCECVLTTDNDVCKCKPCDCVDCKSYLMKADHSHARQIYPVTNQAEPYSEQTCTCKPCDCEKCKFYSFKVNDNGETLTINKTIFNEPSIYQNRTSNVGMVQSHGCSCKPCQCSKCKPMFRVQNNVVVGSMEECLQQNDCLCLPCNCSNCRQLDTHITENLMREMSTDMVDNTNCLCDQCMNHSCRQTTEPCQCESRHSVISKPFVNDNHNIDIHRAVVVKKSNYDKSNQTCTISIDIIESRKDKTNTQTIKDCINDKNSTSECDCKEMDNSCNTSLCPKDSLISSYIKDAKNTTCQCNPCECKICDKYKTAGNGVLKSAKFRSKCNCDICHCIYCNALLQSEKTEPENNNYQMPANSKPGYKFTLNINQSVLKPSSQGLRNVRSKLQKQSAQENKETCTNNKQELGSKRTRGTRNISLQIRAAPSSGTIGYKINNYLMQLPNAGFQPSPAIYGNSIHSMIDNTLVKTFVNEIMRIDKFGSFNFMSSSGSSQNVSLNDVIDSSLTSIWSFPEKTKTVTKVSSTNIIDNKIDICDLKELTVKNNSKYLQKPMQSTYLNKSNDLDKPCIICGMCTFYKKSTETKSDERVQGIRQCFAKTNIALINKNNESIQIINKSVGDNTCRRIKSPLEANATETFEVDSKIVESVPFVEVNENVTLKFCSDYVAQRNILFKAKLLTSELMKMLYKYQKANNEFESVTKKITNVCDKNFENENKLSRESCTANLNFKYSWSTLACISKNRRLDNYQSYSKVDERTNKNIDTLETVIIKTKISQIFSEEGNTKSNFNTDSSKYSNDFSTVFNDLSSKTTLVSKLFQDDYNIFSGKTKKSDDLKNFNKVSYKISKNRDKNYNDHKRYQIIESIIQNFDQDEEKYIQQKSDGTDQLMNEMVVCPPRGEIRQVIKSIYDNCNEIYSCEYLSDNQRGQKCLKCGVDSFKVSSLSLRKISDHTVFIKWDKPSNMSSVQGYELFVDGHVVKKIYNPALTMAVVTCLPRSERILFTIQTLTEPPTGNHSRASMVYCQR